MTQRSPYAPYLRGLETRQKRRSNQRIPHVSQWQFSVAKPVGRAASTQEKSYHLWRERPATSFLRPGYYYNRSSRVAMSSSIYSFRTVSSEQAKSSAGAGTCSFRFSSPRQQLADGNSDLHWRRTIFPRRCRHAIGVACPGNAAELRSGRRR